MTRNYYTINEEQILTFLKDKIKPNYFKSSPEVFAKNIFNKLTPNSGEYQYFSDSSTISGNHYRLYLAAPNKPAV